MIKIEDEFRDQAALLQNQELELTHSWEFTSDCKHFDESFAETFTTDGPHEREYVGNCGIWYMDGSINLWLNDPMKSGENQVIYAIFYAGEANKPAVKITDPTKLKLIDLTQLKTGENILKTENFELIFDLSDLVFDDVETADGKKKIKSFSAKLSLSEKVL